MGIVAPAKTTFDLRQRRTVHLEHQYQLKYRKIRRLSSAVKPASKIPALEFNLKKQRKSFCSIILPLLICVIIAGFSWFMLHHQDAVTNFAIRYHSHYRSILNNKPNYCDRTMELSLIFKNIRADVLNQELALEQLEQAMADESSIQSIALFGSSGLGKSLTMRLLQDQYPWKENVHNIAWNDFEFDNDNDKARYDTVFHMLDDLAHCGRNLIIIDNMTPCDKNYVATINAMLKLKTDVAFGGQDMNFKKLTIIYIFNLNRMLGEEFYERQLEALKELPETTVIHYRNFDVNDLEMCVRHEANVVDMYLDDVHVHDMLDSINVNVSGCKTVRSKVLIYAHP